MAAAGQRAATGTVADLRCRRAGALFNGQFVCELEWVTRILEPLEEFRNQLNLWVRRKSKFKLTFFYKTVYNKAFFNKNGQKPCIN